MLNPARLREDLRQFTLRHGDDVTQGVKNNAARAGSTLVKRE
jgi:hypothetical protein